jgi:phage replication O-like protein O
MRNKHSTQPKISSSEDYPKEKSFRFARPNYTQTPNEFYDEIQKTLKTRGEILVLGTIIRQTIGWGNKEWDRISISQMMAKTGLHRQAVISATKKLIDQGLIIKHKTGTNGVHLCWYKLNIEPSEFENSDDFSSQNEIQSKSLYQCDHHTPTSVIITPTKETKTKERDKVVGNREAPPPPPVFEKMFAISRNRGMEGAKSRNQYHIQKHIQKDKVVGNREAPPPPPVFEKMSEHEERQLIEMAGKAMAKKYSGNAAKTLTSVRFKTSPLRKLSHYELSVKYFQDDAATREKEKSISTDTEKSNENWIRHIAHYNAIDKNDILFSKSYCIIFPTITGDGPKFYYSDTNFRQMVFDRFKIANKTLKEG